MCYYYLIIRYLTEPSNELVKTVSKDLSNWWGRTKWCLAISRTYMTWKRDSTILCSSSCFRSGKSTLHRSCRITIPAMFRLRPWKGIICRLWEGRGVWEQRCAITIYARLYHYLVPYNNKEHSSVAAKIYWTRPVEHPVNIERWWENVISGAKNSRKVKSFYELRYDTSLHYLSSFDIVEVWHLIICIAYLEMKGAAVYNLFLTKLMSK